MNPLLPTLRLLAAALAAVPPIACVSAEAPSPPAAIRDTLGSAASELPDTTARAATIARADSGRIKGKEGTPWLIVISDFQCPYCKQWHEETEPRIDREYVATGKIRVAYMNYPITGIHPNAPAAHDAAMCASEQAKFWPMADALFDTQDAWKRIGDEVAFFDSLAGTLEVDRARFRACIRDGGVRSLVDADAARAVRSGVGSTPSFFIGGRMLIGAQPFAAFKQALDAALAAAPASTPR